jgi:hypothetical protein
MPVSQFKYDPPEGEISGPSFVDQTERALTDIGTFTAETREFTEDTRIMAIAAERAANDANILAGQALSDAARAQETADRGEGKADGAKDSADAAQARADAGYDLAAEGKSIAESAAQDAANAQHQADIATEKADIAQDTAARGVMASAEAYAVAQNALGAYQIVEGEGFNFNGQITPLKLFILDSDNAPAESPVYFESGLDNLRRTCFQRCWNAESPDDVWVRSGTLAENGDDGYQVTWDVWKLDSQDRIDKAETNANAYTDEQIALHGQSTWKIKGSIVGFYDDVPDELASPAEGNVGLKLDGTAKAVYQDGEWTEEPYAPADFDTWHDTSENNEYYWLHGEWNRLDFQADLSLYELKSNRTDVLDLDPETASSEQYPSMKAVAAAFAGISGEIPDVSGKQDKIPAGPGKAVYATAAAGVVELRGAVRATSLLAEDAAPGTALAAPEYVAGSNRLMLFWDGLLAEPGEQYEETGSPGTASQTVTALAAIAAGTRLTFMVI